RAGIGTGEQVRRALASITSENYFSLLGAQPALGRFYNAEECRPNANLRVVVVSYALWQREGGTSDFIGRTIQINGQTYTVIGVAAEGFNGVSAFMAYDLWMPLGVLTRFNVNPLPDLANDETYLLHLTARLAPGVTRESIAAQVPTLNQQLNRLPASRPDNPRELHLEPPSRQSVSSSPSGGDGTTPVAIAVLTMSACVLLIACLNLANLLLARGAQREKEMGIRLALGASRWRIARQLLAESTLLALAGGALGLLLATWGNDLLLHSFAAIASLNGESVALDLLPDGAVFGVTFLLCFGATLVFSVGPTLRASRTDPLSALKKQPGDPNGADRVTRFFSLRHSLVMAQIALSLMLLFSAALFFRGALKASQVQPGFDPSGVLVGDLDYTFTPLTPDRAQQSLLAMLARVREQPGVQSAAAATFVPYSPRSEGRDVRASGPSGQDAERLNVVFTGITDGYFDALGVPVLRGRDFTAAEVEASGPARVAILDEATAQKLFPVGDALGRHVRIGSADAEVIGISAPHRQRNRRATLPDRVFIPYGAAHDGRVFTLVRYRGDDALAIGSLPALRSVLTAFDPNLPLLQITSFSHLVAQDFTAWMSRLGAMLFGFFGALALLLAVVGAYGVKAYAVVSRTREIGIRLALGAQRRDVFSLLLAQGMRQIALALAVGLLLSFAAGRILAKMLYQVSPSDPLALVVSAALLGSAALIACWLPARRATKVDPMIALRAE
ncbi:MAG TPA: ADOP family duplicated permease, partial [Candidatus Synoicihabitans sp.]|nr:ADOP family duplicated permease [Candidatus Synoicihabitans sp.]